MCKKKEKKEVITQASSLDSSKVAQNQEIPIYQSEADKFFDFDEGEEVKDFAFMSDDEGKAEEEMIVAKTDSFVDEDWEDEDMTLAWEDQEEGKDYNFKTVEFNLDEKGIREDQKSAVDENIKLAVNAVEEGKKLIISGHCCSLGAASYNMSLSEKRAKTIRDEMVKGGIPAEKLTIIGLGSESPVVLSDANDRATKIKELGPNRRAEISVH